jgi:hypothetical protein
MEATAGDQRFGCLGSTADMLVLHARPLSRRSKSTIRAYLFIEIKWQHCRSVAAWKLSHTFKRTLLSHSPLPAKGASLLVAGNNGVLISSRHQRFRQSSSAAAAAACQGRVQCACAVTYVSMHTAAAAAVAAAEAATAASAR